MFFFDPTYLLFILPGVGLSLGASFRTKSAFRTYSKVPCARQFTGAQAARLMLDRAGLHRVGIGRSHGLLSDHYNPATRSLALSKDVHDSTSIAAIGVATHEGRPRQPACGPLRPALAAEHPRAHGQHRLVNRLRRDDDRAVHGVAVAGGHRRAPVLRGPPLPDRDAPRGV